MAKRKRRPSRPAPSADSVVPERADEAEEATTGPGEADETATGPGDVVNARFGAGSGVLFALLSFLASSLLAVGEVEATDSAADIAARLVDIRGRVGLGVILMLLSLFFLICFVSYLYRWLRSLEGEGGWFATLAYGGGLLTVGTVSVSVLVAFAGTALEDYGDDPEIARMLFIVGQRADIVSIVPLAALMGATALVAARASELPRWLTTSGIVLAAGLLVVPVAPLLFSTLWIGMLSVTLLSRQGPLFRRR